MLPDIQQPSKHHGDQRHSSITQGELQTSAVTQLSFPAGPAASFTSQCPRMADPCTVTFLVCCYGWLPQLCL